jgi:hypothetical protein
MPVIKTSDSQMRKQYCKIHPLPNGPPDYWVVNSAASSSVFYGPDLLYIQAENSHIYLGISPNRRIKELETQELSCKVLGKYLTHIGAGLSLNLIKLNGYEKKNDDVIFNEGSTIQIKLSEGDALYKILNADCNEK